MAHRIVWSRTALQDLRSIVRYISHDSVARAESFGLQIISEVERLTLSPYIGRAVPELPGSGIRELVVRPYRVIYRIDEAARGLEIVRVWHAARGEPELKFSFQGSELIGSSLTPDHENRATG